MVESLAGSDPVPVVQPEKQFQNTDSLLTNQGGRWLLPPGTQLPAHSGQVTALLHTAHCQSPPVPLRCMLELLGTKQGHQFCQGCHVVRSSEEWIGPRQDGEQDDPNCPHVHRHRLCLVFQQHLGWSEARGAGPGSVEMGEREARGADRELTRATARDGGGASGWVWTRGAGCRQVRAGKGRATMGGHTGPQQGSAACEVSRLALS